MLKTPGLAVLFFVALLVACSNPTLTTAGTASTAPTVNKSVKLKDSSGAFLGYVTRSDTEGLVVYTPSNVFVALNWDGSLQETSTLGYTALGGGGTVVYRSSSPAWGLTACLNGTLFVPLSTDSQGFATADPTLLIRSVRWGQRSIDSYHTVTYDANGADSGAVPVDTTFYGNAMDNAVVPANTGGLTKAGYRFAGWNSAADGSGDSFTPGALTYVGSASQTYYALWTSSATTYTVTYSTGDATAGSAPVDSTSYLPGSYVHGLGNPGGLAKTGYQLVSWNTKSDGSGLAASAWQSLYVTGSVTLYPVWTNGTTYTVTYHANGADVGTVPVDSMSYLPGDAAALKPNSGELRRYGYTLLGWDVSPTSTSPLGVQRVMRTNCDLYAVWSADDENSYPLKSATRTAVGLPATITGPLVQSFE